MQTIQDPVSANIISDRPGAFAELAVWVMDHVRDARRSRDNDYKKRWDQYERVYRGYNKREDRTRMNERSMLISPALTQAIDSISASIEDAIFARDPWFDVVDDVADQQKEDVGMMRQNLKEDFDIAGVPDSIAKIVLNGCLFGTGIGKVNVIKKIVRTPQINPKTGATSITEEARPLVTLEPIHPWEFVIDTNARSIDDALFCAHETVVPKNKVWAKQAQGTYRKLDLGTFFSIDNIPSPMGKPVVDPNHHDDAGAVGACFITEYYGKVPASMLPASADESKDAGGMVEAIITIANEQHVLRAIPTPFLMKDRPVLAYQHNTVSGRFWGCGVAEKGWNSQKALDSELRARMDALGLVTSPMMGADITRLPRNPDMSVRPGKVWLTRGRPSEVLEPIILGDINPATFTQSSDMERLVQVATGSIDSNAPLDTNRRNETASGISMIQSSALKRMKRTMWNLERQFLNPFVQKAMWRYMQFNPERYPIDAKFCVKGTMGIVAREFEQAQLVGLLSNIPPDSPAYPLILMGILELSTTPSRDELLNAVKQSFQPDPEQQKQQQMMQQLQMAQAQGEVQKLQMEIAELQAKIEETKAKTYKLYIEADLEDDKVEIQAANAAVGMKKANVAADQVRVHNKDVENKAKERTSKITSKKK